MSWLLEKALGLILSPIWSAIYNTLVLGLLNTLNYTFMIFNFVTGSDVAKLLFNTSFTDKSPKISFLQSDSVLRPFYITMLTLSSIALVVLIAFSVFASLAKNGSDPERSQVWKSKVRWGLVSTVAMFLVPTGFLTLLSLSGALIKVMEGGKTSLSDQNVGVFQTTLKQKLTTLKDSQENLLKNLNENQKLMVLDKNGVKTDLKISEIYKNMNEFNWGFNTEKESDNDPVSELAQSNHNALYQINKLLKQSTYQTHLANALAVINALDPNVDESLSVKARKATQVKETVVYLNQLSNAITNFNSTTNDILLEYQELDLDADGNLKPIINPQTQKPEEINKRKIAISNFHQVFLRLFGETPVQSTDSLLLSNLQSLKTTLNEAVSGNSLGLNELRGFLSAVQDEPMIVTFYQIASGRKDTIWYESKYITILPTNLAIGVVIIGIALYFMAQNIFYALMRVVNLGLQLLLSAPMVVASVADNGNSLRQWFSKTLGNMFAILGSVLMFKVFGLLYQSFTSLIQESAWFKTEAGYFISLLLQGAFALTSIVAAKMANQQIASYFNLPGRSFGQTRIGSALSRAKGAFSKGGGKMLGGLGAATGLLTGWSKNSSLAGFRNDLNSNGKKPLVRQRLRQGLGNVWNRNIAKPASVLSNAKFGTKRSKNEWLSYRQRVNNDKKFRLENRLRNQSFVGETFFSAKRSSKLSKVNQNLQTITNRKQNNTEGGENNA